MILWFIISALGFFAYHKAILYRDLDSALLVLAGNTPILMAGLMTFTESPGQAIGLALVINGIVFLIERNIYANLENGVRTANTGDPNRSRVDATATGNS